MCVCNISSPNFNSFSYKFYFERLIVHTCLVFRPAYLSKDLSFLFCNFIYSSQVHYLICLPQRVLGKESWTMFAIVSQKNRLANSWQNISTVYLKVDKSLELLLLNICFIQIFHCFFTLLSHS